MHYQLLRDKIYYIVDLKKLAKPKLFRNEFKTKEEAEETVISHLRYDFINYSTISGKDAKNHQLEFKNWKKGRYALCMLVLTKYEYPAKRDTQQSRKNYRTMSRRNLRKQNKQ